MYRQVKKFQFRYKLKYNKSPLTTLIVEQDDLIGGYNPSYARLS
jgi:hypothetical protein